MLTEAWRREAQRRRLTVEPDRAGGDADAIDGIGPTLAERRQRLGHGVDRARGDVGGQQVGDDLVARTRPDCVREPRGELSAGLEPLRIRREPPIGVVEPEGIEQTAELGVVADRDDQVPVGGCERLVRNDVGVRISVTA